MIKPNNSFLEIISGTDTEMCMFIAEKTKSIPVLEQDMF